MRITVIRNIIFGLLALIAFDLFYLQVIRGGYFFRQSEHNAIRLIPFEGKRGRILDRNGKALARSERSFCAAILPQDYKGGKDIFRFLAGALDADADQLEARFKRYRRDPFSPVVVAQDISRQQAIVVEENAYEYPGLLVMERYSRQYASGSAGAHVIGYVSKPDESMLRLIREYGRSADELVGYAGVEKYQDDLLRAKAGGRQIQVNSRGQQVRLLSMLEPLPGKDLALTIDQDMQRAAYHALDGRKGAAVLMDPANGEILAMTSFPAYDPNDFAEREDRSRAAAYLRSADAPMLDRVAGAQFPPGSVFKVIVAIAGLQERRIKPSTTFDCPGYFDLGGRRFSFAHAYGPQDLVQAMAHSANEYFFHTGLLVGADTIARYAALFGLGERTGIDLPYELKGAIPRRGAFARWFAGDTANMSIGQGYVLTTPVQIARLMAVIENEGRFVDPHVALDAARPVSHRAVALRPDVWKIIKQSLRAAVKIPSGTANTLDLEGMEVYGKTGTAQAGAGRSDHAWFAGVVKTSQRKLVIVVLLEHGGSSQNACNASKDLLLSLQLQGKI